MTINTNTNRLLPLLGFCILTSSVFAQTTTSTRVITPKTKTVTTHLTSVVSKAAPPIIVTDKLISFVIEDDIMKQDEEEDSKKESLAKKQYSGNNNSGTESEQVTKVKELELEKNINIFPLPAKDYFNVSIENNLIDNIMLVSGNGQIIFNQINASHESIIRVETSNMAKGIYFVILNTSNGRISKSILIQ